MDSSVRSDKEERVCGRGLCGLKWKAFQVLSAGVLRSLLAHVISQTVSSSFIFEKHLIGLEN